MNDNVASHTPTSPKNCFTFEGMVRKPPKTTLLLKRSVQLVIWVRELEITTENSPDSSHSLGELNTRMHEWLRPNIGSVGESVSQRERERWLAINYRKACLELAIGGYYR